MGDGVDVEDLMSADLRRRVRGLQEREDIINSWDLDKEYDEAKALFQRELPKLNFDEYLGPSLIKIVNECRQSKIRCEPKLREIQKRWNLDRNGFIQRFGKDMASSYRFVSPLLQVAQIAALTDAFAVMDRIRQERMTRRETRAGVSMRKPWQPCDATKALAELRPLQEESLAQQSRLKTQKRRRGELDDEEPVSSAPERRKSATQVAQSRSRTPTPGPVEGRMLSPLRLLQAAKENEDDRGSLTEQDIEHPRCQVQQLSDIADDSTQYLGDAVDGASDHALDDYTIASVDESTSQVAPLLKPESLDTEPLTPPQTHPDSFSPPESQDPAPLPLLEPQSMPLASSIPPTTLAGALSSLADGTWVSATAIDLVLDVFRTEGFRVVDNTFVNVAKPAELGSKRLRIKAESVLIQRLLDSDHWTVLFINLETGAIEYADSLRQQNSTLPANIQSVLEHYTACLSSDNRFRNMQWKFTAQDCARQDNASDCGIYMLLAILYRMAHLPQPETIDAGLWRKIFRSAITSKSVSADSTNSPLNSSVLNGISLHGSLCHDVSGLDALSGHFAHISTLVDKRIAKTKRDLQHANQKLRHSQDASVLLSRFLENSENVLHQVAAEKDGKNTLLGFHKHMQNHLEELPRDASLYSLGTDRPLELGEAMRQYRELSIQGVEKAAAEMEYLLRKATDTHRRRDALRAGKHIAEAEKIAWTTRVTRLEELAKALAMELHAFYTAQIELGQKGLENLRDSGLIGL